MSCDNEAVQHYYTFDNRLHDRVKNKIQIDLRRQNNFVYLFSRNTSNNFKYSQTFSNIFLVWHRSFNQSIHHPNVILLLFDTKRIWNMVNAFMSSTKQKCLHLNLQYIFHCKTGKHWLIFFLQYF